jgi:hypothetical protein
MVHEDEWFWDMAGHLKSCEEAALAVIWMAPCGGPHPIWARNQRDVAFTSGWRGLNDFVYYQALALVAAKMGLH